MQVRCVQLFAVCCAMWLGACGPQPDASKPTETTSPVGRALPVAGDAGPWRLGESLLRAAETAAEAGDLEVMERHYTQWRQRFEAKDAPDAAMSTLYAAARAYARAGDSQRANVRRKHARRLYERLGRPAETPAATMVAELVFLHADSRWAELRDVSLAPVPVLLKEFQDALVAHNELVIKITSGYDEVSQFGSEAWETAAMVRIGDARWCQAAQIEASAVPRDSKLNLEKYRVALSALLEPIRSMATDHWKNAAERKTAPAGGTDWSKIAAKRPGNPPSC